MEFEIIDRMLAKVSYQTTTEWIECYLHEDSLSEHRFTVVERTSRKDFKLLEFDDEEIVRIKYAAVEKRTKAAIAEHLLK